MPKKPTFEQVLNNAFLEEARFEYPILDESKTESSKHHFMRMTIEDVQRAANEDLVSILEANRVRIDDKTLDLRRLVLYEKCFHLHMAIARKSRGRNCDYCLAEITCSRRCSQCKVHRYCDRDCQIKHWPVHKAFCNLHQRRTEEQHRLSQTKLDEDPTILKGMKKFVVSQMWNGKDDNYFQETLAVVQKTWKDMSAEHTAMFLTSLPPTIAQAHGHMELWKMTSYVLEQCETTEFQHEQKAWLSVLEYIWDPHWPESTGHPETLFLQPNVKAFVERDGLHRLLKLMLNKPTLVEPISSVFHHLSRYREIIKVSNEQHSSGPAIPLGSNSDGGAVLFNKLTPEIRELIFNDFLRGKNAQGISDQINFGRCSRASAQLVCEVLDRTAQSQFIKGSCKLEDLMTSFEKLLKRVEGSLEKALGGLQVKQAGSKDPQRFLQPKCQRWSLKIHELSQAFENSFLGLRRVFCAQLQTRYCMQVGDRDKSKSALPLEILILRSCENAIELRTKWVAPYSNIATWISQNNAEQAVT